MEIVVLGTGSADGWPNAFCRCASCADARARGLRRSPTCALVDGRLLLDCGPHLEAQASAADADLADVRTLLVTHAHHDHLDPAFLMHRGWVTDAPLTIAGPPAVIEGCRHWLAPDQDAVTLVELAAGDEVVLDGYRVRALPAEHHAFGPCLLSAVEGTDGSLLYATDTGPWVDAAAAHLAGLRFDVVLMEETFGERTDLGSGHLHLPGFAAELDALRALRCVDEATTVAAVHLSHHNPPYAELRAHLAELGAHLVPDGARLWA